MFIVMTLAASVVNFGYPVQRLLGQHGWDGETVACIGLELSPDNRRVVRGQFMIRGPLARDPVVLQAAKLWEKADKEATVTITFPQGAEFSFDTSTLTSDYLDGAAVKMAISKQDQIVLPTNWPGLGIGEICFRLVAHLDKSSNGANSPRIPFTVLAFPRSVTQLDELSELTKGASWPGIKVLEGEAALFPNTRLGAWGCPIFPILCPGARLDQVRNLPSGAELRFTIAKVMGTARLPTAMATSRTMGAKWKKLLDGSEEYEERIPTVIWPDMALPDQDTGKNFIIFYIIFVVVLFVCCQAILFHCQYNTVI